MGTKKNPAIIFFLFFLPMETLLYLNLQLLKISKLGFYVIVYDRRGEDVIY